MEGKKWNLCATLWSFCGLYEGMISVLPDSAQRGMAAYVGCQVERHGQLSQAPWHMKTSGRMKTCRCVGVRNYEQRNALEHLSPQKEEGIRLLGKLKHLKTGFV